MTPVKPPGILVPVAPALVWFLAGAILCEILFARKTLEEAARAGLGAGLGLLASTAGKAAAALLMVGLVLADCFLFL